MTLRRIQLFLKTLNICKNGVISKSVTETLTKWSNVCKCHKHFFKCKFAADFLVGTCTVINFLTFYFGQGFVEKMYCISESSVAIPKSGECMCCSTFHRCMCIVYELYTSVQFMAWICLHLLWSPTCCWLFQKNSVAQRFKNQICRTYLSQKDITSFIWKIKSPVLLESNRKYFQMVVVF